MTELEPHPLAQLFPPISEEELAQLGRDLALHGQLEPIVLYQGKILDGVNRYRACRRMNREPWTIEFNQESVKRTPEEYAIAANVLRRHLTQAQRAAIAVEWAERVEQDWSEGRSNTIVARVDKTGVQGGRPKTTALQDTARLVGVSVSAAYEARRIKTANETFFAELKAGRRSLGSALDEIRPPAPEPGQEPAMSATEDSRPGPESKAAETLSEIPAGGQPQAEEILGGAGSANGRTAKEMVNQPPRLTRQQRISAAWAAVASIFGFGPKSLQAYRAKGQLSDAEAIEFSDLASNADKLEVRAALLRGQSFRDAVQALAHLDPKDPIQKLHTRTVKSGGSYLGEIGAFLHIVAHGEEARAELLERLKGWPAK